MSSLYNIKKHKSHYFKKRNDTCTKKYTAKRKKEKKEIKIKISNIRNDKMEKRDRHKI